jgi:hypothetical protein
MRYPLGENADQKRRKAEIGMAGQPLALGGIELDDLDALQQINLELIVRADESDLVIAEQGFVLDGIEVCDGRNADSFHTRLVAGIEGDNLPRNRGFLCRLRSEAFDQLQPPAICHLILGE